MKRRFVVVALATHKPFIMYFCLPT